MTENCFPTVSFDSCFGAISFRTFSSKIQCILIFFWKPITSLILAATTSNLPLLGAIVIMRVCWYLRRYATGKGKL